ncbi:DEAD/DEAH box helicase [Bacillus sp. NTK034]|uniref:DEAD/DEAH box helicase n=1 Tax=Bacillus sp. NTK034 TaxID=2802176 RepID=UPI001A8E21F0|nr:DEAD/DEAH box helicase [Bacillus sp. NTK034]MBN8201539.1 DEAD/DEAH box helicase [Bacillus sp. NTK034]
MTPYLQDFPTESFPIPSIETIQGSPLNEIYPFNRELQQLLYGKQLLFENLPHSIEELHQHYENGCINYRKGITKIKNKKACARCGNKDRSLFASFTCARCGEKECTYCRKCIMMGRVSECTPLIGWCGPEPDWELTENPLVWAGTLSPGQQIASVQVKKALIENKELLVWAVCGAGKTEVLFEGINAALASGKRVSIATPRTDVVLELGPRLKGVFPGITIAVLYGGSEDRHLQAPITIATTHQLLRFYKAFDTVILDEVDAFPYTADESLQYAVRQSRKENSSMIYLTATPNQKWQKECRSGKRNFVTIPARYHRHPLPVPSFKWCGNWEKSLRKDKLPSAVSQWIKKRLDNQKQCLLFLPKIDKMEKVLTILRKTYPKIQAVHAEDPDRKDKVQMMRNKEIPMLLTTTILERGVTFPNIDVAVLGAEDRIFTESALVQIAGRVGRSAQFPSGDITFFHYGKTESMVKAQKQILKMNTEAKKKGLIDN